MSIPAAPGRPIAAVLAVVIRDGRALLVRRANTPDAGLWGFPGGKIEPGEPILVAAERELHEETGVQARARGVITALDAFEAGAPRRH
ncbi:MAG: NUDIX domain-containing protein, partial [Paracoccaceae bacterium]